MAQSNHIVEIFKARNNLLDILKEQNYDVSEYQGSNINEINTMYISKQMDMILTKYDKSKKAYIKFHLNKSLRNNNIYEYIDDLFNLEEILNKKDDLIIIIKDEPNEPLIKTLQNIWEQDNIYINVFNIKRLQFNILNHNLVPKHRVLSSQEKEEIKKKFNINDDKMVPNISRLSPVAQAIGIRPGEYCEITRASKTSVNSKFYRICSP